MTNRQQMIDLAEDLSRSVGLYKKLSDGRMTEMHLTKIVMIQEALRSAAEAETAADLIHDLLGLELGASERAMAWLEARTMNSRDDKRIPRTPGYGGPLK